MKKKTKVIILIPISIISLMIIIFGVYLLVHRQRTAAHFEVNSPELEKKMLIATQGSAFKDAVVAAVVKEVGSRPIYIKVIDVSKLDGVEEDRWDAVVLIHTTEAWKLQPDVERFLSRAKDPGRVILVTTSGSGEWKADDFDVDTITSASRPAEQEPVAAAIVGRLSTLVDNTLPAQIFNKFPE
ncbi:MAG: hypothetical protein V1789_06770 [PVC group bacterium]